MGDLVRMRSTGQVSDSGSMGRSDTASPATGSMARMPEEWETIVQFDAKRKDLRLLQYRRRRLEEQKLVLYRASTKVELAVGADHVEVDVSVLVKKRLVEYYFYCPMSGRRVSRHIDCLDQHGVECLGLSWPEIQQMVLDAVSGSRQSSRQQSMRVASESGASRQTCRSDIRLNIVPKQEECVHQSVNLFVLLRRFFRKFSAMVFGFIAKTG